MGCFVARDADEKLFCNVMIVFVVLNVYFKQYTSVWGMCLNLLEMETITTCNEDTHGWVEDGAFFFEQAKL